jgi:glycosyltransferase involved in cell wall biosynthesis
MSMRHQSTFVRERVTLVDLDCRGAEHEFYNAACVLSISTARPLAQLTVAARPEHLKVLRTRLLSLTSRPGFASLPPDLPQGRSLWSQYRMLTKLLAHVHVRTDEDTTDTVVFLSCSIRSFIVMKWIALLYPSFKFVFIFHGLLERLDRDAKSSTSVSSRLFRILFKTRTSTNITYCVLGEGILKVLKHTAGQLSTPCIAIDSPYLFDDKVKTGTPDQGPAVFGHLGYAHAEKGFLDFVSLAQTLSDSRARNTARFRVVGGTDRSDPRVNQAPELDYVLHDWPVPRDQYEAALTDVTYAVFLYPPGSYRLRASGALFDAIAAGKPVIALRNPYFDHVFKAVGDIGYLCDDMDDLIRVCREVAQRFPRDRYQQQQQHLAMARVRFSPASIAEQWNTQFFGAQQGQGAA